MKILFLVPYPAREAPSQRFRIELYEEILSAKGMEFESQSFLNSHDWQIFFRKGNTIKKCIALAAGFWNRLLMLFSLSSVDFVFIHREAAPIGPPILEWIIAKVLRKKIIYDFDDAIWMTDKKSESTLEKIIRWRSKVGSICRWSYKVSAGNEYLCAFARQFTNQVVLNPTVLDTEKVHNPVLYPLAKSLDDQVIIGWTGSHSTLKYLSEQQDVLQRLEKKYPQVYFLVIADRPADLKLDRVLFKTWSKETEVSDLLLADIGIMPLPDDAWAKGKCGFKALQYMALNIPAVVSAVGVNTEIIEQGENGFLCTTAIEWQWAMEQLIENTTLRKTLGKNGREKIVNQFSLSANAPTFLSLFE